MSFNPFTRSTMTRATLSLAIAAVCSVSFAAGSGPMSTSSVPTATGPGAPSTAQTTPIQKSMLVEMQDAFTNIAQSAEPFVVNIKAERAIDTSQMPKELPEAPDSGNGPDDNTPDNGQGTTPAPGGKVPAPGTKPSLPGGKPGAKAPDGSTKVPAPGSGAGGDVDPFPRKQEATGSGAIVSPDGYIITNDHVVEGSPTVTVSLNDGREFVGKVYEDHSSDLAVVKIDPGSAKLPYCAFADSDKVEAGQWAIAIGSPFDLANTMTVGVISALHRHQTIGDSPANLRYYPDLIQTDAAINPGNSGGPLINIDGQVVGINVAIESPTDSNSGIGFAIPAQIAQRIMNQLITNGKVVRGYLGLAPADLTPAKELTYGVPAGAWVMQVDMDSPAGKAGIHAADIITSFDSKTITNELTLRLAIAETKPGATVPVKLIRDGKEVDYNVTIAAPPVPEGTTGTPAVAPTAQTHKIGISVRTLAPADRDQLSLQPTATGAFVTNVLNNSPADHAGLLANDVITKIGTTPILTAEDAAKALGALTPGTTTTIIVTRSAGGARLQELAIDLQTEM